jgi:hypothetical protein
MPVAGRVVTTVLDWFPPLVTDEALLFFLVRVGKGPGDRTSLRVPPRPERRPSGADVPWPEWPADVP